MARFASVAKKYAYVSGLFIALGAALAGCGGMDSKAQYPDKEREETYRQGSLLSESGGIDLLGGDRSKDQATGITVNAYL